MALYVPSAIVPIISGGIGGQVFSHNTGGPYIKNKVIPINPVTTYQVSARALFTTYSQAWKGLSSTNKLAWNAFAAANPVINRVGALITLSGINMYIRLNSVIINSGGVAITAPPFPFNVPALTTLTGTCIAAVLSVAFTVTPVPATTSLFLWATPPLSLGVSYAKAKFRLFKVIAAAATSPQVVTTFYNARFGAPPAVAGAQIFLEGQFANQLTGAVSAKIRVIIPTA